MSPARSPTAFTVAAVQATPVFLDREATVERACELIAEAGRGGARLIVLPESFIPCYPDWVWAVPPGEMGLLGQLYAQLVANAVDIPGSSTQRLCQAARRAKAYVVVGMTERNSEASGGSLYNTLLYIDAAGEIIGTHRKLVPTSAERLVWAQGDGSTLGVYDTPLGKLGGLTCWENYMPLARYAMYAWGTELYVAPTWARSDLWLASLRHIAAEGRMYVIGCCMALRLDDIPDSLESKRFYKGDSEWINIGNSVIVDPLGNFIAGPVIERQEILYAEIDLEMTRSSKSSFDAAGHYARPDVFQLTVNTEPRPMIVSSNGTLAPVRPTKAATQAKRRSP